MDELVVQGVPARERDNFRRTPPLSWLWRWRAKLRNSILKVNAWILYISPSPRTNKYQISSFKSPFLAAFELYKPETSQMKGLLFRFREEKPSHQVTKTQTEIDARLGKEIDPQRGSLIEVLGTRFSTCLFILL